MSLRIQHCGEASRKNSAIPLTFLAPNHVSLKVWNDDEIGVYSSSDTVLLFPSQDAKDVRELPWKPIKNILVIDGSWQAAKMIASNPRFNSLSRIKLRPYKTNFWRYNNGSFDGATNLATAEAVYYLLRDIRVQSPELFKSDSGTFNDEGQTELASTSRRESKIAEQTHTKAMGAKCDRGQNLDDLLFVFAMQLEKIKVKSFPSRRVSHNMNLEDDFFFLIFSGFIQIQQKWLAT
eukprot:Gregarina_sp_Poly_1__1428@NODE_1357_length_4305_cov_171_765691_g13_i1_p2_GENE_NODE_1357_length_4305_cov_171_765691_g13_i1NODE_1357_length_4305_cov_171_765691_g13_i1_p2_ORF_typecomplete_len235_score37_83DTW/PF03942_15/5_9e22Uso1_p115_C/PF04871_13/0_14_NODE_1357_length_4305_cov_171_765691_g13_i1198902